MKAQFNQNLLQIAGLKMQVWKLQQEVQSLSHSKILQVLEDGHWIDVQTRARTTKGMIRVYKRMCAENRQGPPYGMRIVTIHMEQLGRFPAQSYT